jgi:hypothetical protein
MKSAKAFWYNSRKMIYRIVEKAFLSYLGKTAAVVFLYND